MNIRAGVAVVALSIFSSVALAQSLKDKEYFADQEKYLAERLPPPTSGAASVSPRSLTG
jgi:hypothetical protein